MKVGILALQGAVEPHEKKLNELGIPSQRVRLARDLADLSGIILPGGESSTMLHLLKLNQLWEPLSDFLQSKPAWGVCAGAILLAREVHSPEQESFQIIDINVERNAFGRQLDSFIASLDPAEDELPRVEGVFIRAPRIRSFGSEVRALYTFKGEVVMAEQGRTLASTFHPELTSHSELHRYFIEKCK